MIEAVTIGPFLVPTRPAVVAIALVVAVLTTWGAAARGSLDAPWIRGVAEGAAWIGVLGARVGYVVANWGAFRPEPWTALYVWQPGYLPHVGVAIGGAYALWRIWRLPRPVRGRNLRALAAGYAGGAATLGALVYALHALAPADMLRAGGRVPDFTLVDSSGNTARWTDLEGRVVVVNFWATWCPPCLREMPLLDAIHAKYEARGLTVIGVDLDEPAEVVARFVARTGVRYPIWLDPGPPRADHDRTRAIYERFGGVGLPTTIFVDSDGTIRDVHVGELNRAILEERAESLLAR